MRRHTNLTAIKEMLPHILSYFVVGLTDAGPYPGTKALSANGHGAYQTPQDAFLQAFPTGMGCSHYSPLHVPEENRDAVSSKYGKGLAWFVSPYCIRIRRIAQQRIADAQRGVAENCDV